MFRVLIGFLCLYGLLFAAWIGSFHRSIFGQEVGNWLMLPEIIFITVVVVAIRFLSAGRKREAAALGWVGGAVVFAFLAWATYPPNAYKRALDRHYDYEDALDNYRRHQSDGTVHVRSDVAPPYGRDVEEEYEPPDPASEAEIKFDRIRREQAARGLELQAAEIRREGDAAFFRSNFHTLEFTLISACMGALAIITWRSLAQSGVG